MASLNEEVSGNRNGYRLQFRTKDQRKRSIWLGGMSKRDANKFCSNVESLIESTKANAEPDAKIAAWANGLDERFQDSLVKLELVKPRMVKVKTDAGKMIGPYLDSYITGRIDCKPGTITNYRYARRELVNHFGETRLLRSINAADADRWRRAMVSRGLAPATISKYVKRAKTMFAEAVRDELLPFSPFADQKGGVEANKDRHYFVTAAITKAVAGACPNDDWRVIFALARWAGLRCPSEVLGLKWSDVLWDEKRLRIDSPKTGLRFCPIFPELLPVLEQAFDNAAEGSVHCIRRYRGGVNLATQLHRIIEKAGMVPWPKTFINLRSTRRTELQERFPSHVVDAWLGHSTKTAERHYLQVTADHWEAGAADGSEIDPGGSAGGSIIVNQGGISAHRPKAKPLNSLGKEGLRCLMIACSITLLGLEPRMRESKSLVLPLHYRAIVITSRILPYRCGQDNICLANLPHSQG